VRDCLDVVGELHRRGIDSRRFCQQLCDHFRNLLFLALEGGERRSQLDLPREEREYLGAEVAKTTPESLYLYFQMLLKGEEEIRRSTLPRITLEMLLLRLSQLPRLESLEKVLEKITLLEGRLSEEGRDAVRSTSDPASMHSAPSPSASRRPEELSSPEVPAAANDIPGPFPVPGPPAGTAGSGREVTAAEAAGRWLDFLQWLQTGDAILSAKLKDSHALPGNGTTLELEVLEIFEDTFKDPKSRAHLTKVARDFFGQEFQWVIHRKASPKGEAEDASSRKPSRPSSKRKVMEHPVVMQALEILGGELVDIRRPKTEKPEESND
jgi:DNA polymerase-3 subunit gamma/tau